MLRAAALGLLFAGGARADSSVPPSGEPAANRRTWGELCLARFQLAQAETVKLEPSFSTGKVILQAREDSLPLADEVIFGWTHGKPNFRAAVMPAAANEDAQLWHDTGVNVEKRTAGGRTATVTARLSFDAPRVERLRALWREAADDCLQAGAPLPRASARWAQGCVDRLARARDESVAVDARFTAGTLEVTGEQVRFAFLPDWRVEVHPQSDADFNRPRDVNDELKPRDAGNGWLFLPNHPHHSFPPSRYALHRHDRTADLFEQGGAGREALMAIWQRAAAECLELK